jgi:hypothetical protein
MNNQIWSNPLEGFGHFFRVCYVELQRARIQGVGVVTRNNSETSAGKLDYSVAQQSAFSCDKKLQHFRASSDNRTSDDGTAIYKSSE